MPLKTFRSHMLFRFLSTCGAAVSWAVAGAAGQASARRRTARWWRHGHLGHGHRHLWHHGWALLLWHLDVNGW